jgi:hypothetical protein
VNKDKVKVIIIDIITHPLEKIKPVFRILFAEMEEYGDHGIVTV